MRASDGGGDGECDVEFMRANAKEEMRRVLGAKAANVQLAVPTLAAGDWSVDSEGDSEESSGV